MRTLVIVESKTKADKIQSYLGGNYIVKACKGHVRDLPQTRAEVPEAIKGEPWGALSIDIANGYKLYYVVPEDQKARISDLRQTARQVDEVILASDPDREGEAIAAALASLLGLDKNAKRVTFNSITREAILTAMQSPRKIDYTLVSAQEARRAADRIMGFTLSPKLSRAFGRRGMSAGRVQSAALAALTRQELARLRHVAQAYTRLTVEVKVGEHPSFTAALLGRSNTPLASPKDFGEDGQVKEGVWGLGAAEGKKLAASLRGCEIDVLACQQSPYRSGPPVPFITSTMQQEASKQLKLSPKETMELAQSLYEAGKITYMRTDSPSLSEEGTQAAREAVSALFGAGALPASARAFAAKAVNAQEAHEGVRPTGKIFTPPDQTGLEGNALALYDLIYRRTVASQMNDVQGLKTVIHLGVDDLRFGVQGKVVTDPGYTALYQDAKETEGGETEDEPTLPLLQAGAKGSIEKATAEQRKTPAPKRFTEASLIKALERAEIGRPSTYVATLETLHERGYTQKVGSSQQLAVTFLGLLTSQYLQEHFAALVNPQRTALMEGQLDQIASGQLSYEAFLDNFWKGELEGLLQAAPLRTAVVELARVPGASVGMHGGEPTLKYGGEFKTIPAGLLPEDMTLEVAGKVIRGEKVSPKKSRAKKEKEADASPPKEKKPRKKKAE